MLAGEGQAEDSEEDEQEDVDGFVFATLKWDFSNLTYILVISNLDM